MMQKQKGRASCLILVILFLLVMLPYLRGLEKPAMAMDEGSLLLYPELVLRGKVPYRDFETFYGPANPYVIAAGYKLFGVGIFVERGVGLLYRLAIFSAIFALGFRTSRITALAATALASMLLLPLGTAAYAWLGAVACGLWSLWFLSRATEKWHGAAAGVLAALALLFRQDLGPAVILSAMPFLWRLARPAQLFYLVGGALGLAPLLLITCLAGPEQVFNNLFGYPVLHGNGARRLPVSSIDFTAVYLGGHLVATLFGLVVGALSLRSNPPQTSARVLLAASLFSLGLTHQALQRADIFHILSAAFVSVALLPLAAVQSLQLFKRLPVSNSTVLAAALASLVLVFASFPELIVVFRGEFAAVFKPAASQPVFLDISGRKFPAGDMQTARELGRMVAELERRAKPGERLFVGPGDLRRTSYTDTFIYHLMPHLTPATYFLEMNPLSANRPNSRLATDVASADWLVLNKRYDRWNEPNRSAEFGSDAPNKIIQEEFQLRWSSGEYLIYQHKLTPARL